MLGSLCHILLVKIWKKKIEFDSIHFGITYQILSIRPAHNSTILLVVIPKLIEQPIIQLSYPNWLNNPLSIYLESQIKSLMVAIQGFPNSHNTTFCIYSKKYFFRGGGLGFNKLGYELLCCILWSLESQMKSNLLINKLSYLPFILIIK